MRRCKPETGRIVIGNVSRPGVCEREVDLAVFRRNAQRRTFTAQQRIFWIQHRTFGVERSAFVYNFLYNFAKLTDLIEPNKRIHLRHFLAQFFRESLRPAAAYDLLLMWSSV